MTKDATSQRHGRLQRLYSKQGAYVSTFVQVAYRHGLVMGIVAIMLVLLSTAEDPLLGYTTALSSSPERYLLACVVMVVLFVCFGHVRRIGSFPVQGFWITYLLYISIVEELIFRVLLPNMLSFSLHTVAAIVASNAIFAGFHYFTLRWRLANCIAVFFGGLGLSRLLNNTEDVALIVLVHWLVTFINTPTYPGGR